MCRAFSFSFCPLSPRAACVGSCTVAVESVELYQNRARASDPSRLFERTRGEERERGCGKEKREQVSDVHRLTFGWTIGGLFPRHCRLKTRLLLLLLVHGVSPE